MDHAAAPSKWRYRSIVLLDAVVAIGGRVYWQQDADNMLVIPNANKNELLSSFSDTKGCYFKFSAS